jgi:hypothetical protein
VVIVVVIVIVVAVRFFAWIAVTAHAALIFGFPPEVKRISAFSASPRRGRRLDPSWAGALG